MSDGALAVILVIAALVFVIGAPRAWDWAVDRLIDWRRSRLARRKPDPTDRAGA